MVLPADCTGSDSDLDTVQRAQPSQSSSTAAGVPNEAAGTPWVNGAQQQKYSVRCLDINEAGDRHQVLASVPDFKDSMQKLDQKLRQDILTLEVKMHAGSRFVCASL